MGSHHGGISEDDSCPQPEGMNDLGSNKHVKGDRSRRNWTAREEEILMTTLKELAANGWKADNGFRSGYLVRAREAIKREFPNTDILPHPHIYSKMTTWKRNYGSLKMMLNFSGIGFNTDGTYRIEADDESWAQFVKKDSNARYMRNKSWPQYEDWKEVFGVDRADGEHGIDVGAAADKLYGHKEVSPDDAGPPHTLTFEELFPEEVFPDGVLPDGVLPETVDESHSFTGFGADVTGAGAGKAAAAERESGSGSGARQMPKKDVKKRKLEDKVDGVLTLMGQIHTDTNERLKEISARIGYEFDLSTKRTEVFDQMKDIPGLTLKQQFYIAKKLVKEPELLDLFRGLHETARAAFVFDLLDTDGQLG